MKIDKLKNEIKLLREDVTYDIDREHHNERMKILKEKRIELKELLKK